jgi:hypothetical protein
VIKAKGESEQGRLCGGSTKVKTRGSRLVIGLFAFGNVDKESLIGARGAVRLFEVECIRTHLAGFALFGFSGHVNLGRNPAGEGYKKFNKGREQTNWSLL